MDQPHPLEGGVAVLRGLIADRAQLEAEFQASRTEFFTGEPPGPERTPEQLLADRRHLEWFAFERSSESMGDVPATALFDAWMEAVELDARVFADALLHSRTGVFEVKSVEAGVGMWVEDMLGHGSYPVDEAEASAQIAAGDVLAGRLFPVGDSQFRLSPAVAVYRNPRLREALTRDLEILRQGRRGTLRVSQAEIERMFFPGAGGVGVGGAAPAEDPQPAPDPAVRRAALMEKLAAGGLDADEVADWLVTLTEVAAADQRSAAVVTAELMDRAAFQSDVDLDELRGELHALVAEVRAAAAAAAVPSDPSAKPAFEPLAELERAFGAGALAPAIAGGAGDDAAPARVEEDDDTEPLEREAIERALAQFDAGRDAGKPLEDLFGQLERELGLEGTEREESLLAPDFPGVVGALVEEFLWERDAEQRALQPAAAASLRDLAARCQKIGVADELDVQHLVDFAARWAIDSGRLGERYTAEQLLGALAEFAEWTEESQQIPLWTAFRRLHGELAAELPRVAAVNELLGDPDAEAQRRARLLTLAVDRDGETLGAEDRDGDFRPLEDAALPASAAATPREGDIARLVAGPNAWRLLRIYPSAGRSV